MERRFQPVKVGEPTPEQAVQILKGLRDSYEAHHKVKITDEAINAAVTLSSRYIADRYLPDKAIDLIDEGASKVRLASLTSPDNVKELEDEIADYEKKRQAQLTSRTLKGLHDFVMSRRNFRQSLTMQRRSGRNNRRVTAAR